MPFTLRVPLIGRDDHNPLMISIDSGDAVFLLGANGVGKSSLMQVFNVQNPNSVRILAHRQSWLHRDVIARSSVNRVQNQANVIAHYTQATTRFSDPLADTPVGLAFKDILDAEYRANRDIAERVRHGQNDEAVVLARDETPLNVINRLFIEANLSISVVADGSDTLMARRNGGDLYSIDQMSDGERNALMIASAVLASKSGSLLLIDEPERHLHRSIISPLLSGLLRQRSDCAFVISTHDVGMVADQREARTLLVRDCEFSNGALRRWDVDLIDNNQEFDDRLLEDILGCRRKILFVEGINTSLDKTLYAIIFPNVSLVSKKSCRLVEKAVNGVRDSEANHWIKAFGIVDNDCRSVENIDMLKDNGIYALPCFSIESIYYHPDVQRRVTARKVGIEGGNLEERLNNSNIQLVRSVRHNAQRLAERVAEYTIRQRYLSCIPTRQQVADREPIAVTFEPALVLDQEFNRLQQACDASDVAAILSRYPVRETGALGQVATALQFTGRDQYERSVRKLLEDDMEALETVRGLFNGLFEAITEA